MAGAYSDSTAGRRQRKSGQKSGIGNASQNGLFAGLLQQQRQQSQPRPEATEQHRPSPFLGRQNKLGIQRVLAQHAARPPRRARSAPQETTDSDPGQCDPAPHIPGAPASAHMRDRQVVSFNERPILPCAPARAADASGSESTSRHIYASAMSRVFPAGRLPTLTNPPRSRTTACEQRRNSICERPSLPERPWLFVALSHHRQQFPIWSIPNRSRFRFFGFCLPDPSRFRFLPNLVSPFHGEPLQRRDEAFFFFFHLTNHAPSRKLATQLRSQSGIDGLLGLGCGSLRDVQSSGHGGGAFCSTSALTPSRLGSSGKNERHNPLVVKDQARSLDHSSI